MQSEIKMEKVWVQNIKAMLRGAQFTEEMKAACLREFEAALSTDAEPVAWVEPEIFETLKAGGSGMFPISNSKFKGARLTIPLYAEPVKTAPAVAVKAGPLAYALADELERMGRYRPNVGILHDALSRVLPALSAQVQDVAGLSKWQGWDKSNLPWSEAKHKDAVCYAAFGEAWSMNDAAALIGFIERTWTAAPDAKQEANTMPIEEIARLKTIITDAEADIAQDYAEAETTGERPDLHDNEITLSLADAKALVAALSTDAEGAGWQTIETAPKHKSCITCSWWDSQKSSPFVQEGFLDLDGKTWKRQSGHDWHKDISYPTHWMPLPAAPAAKQEG